MAGRASSCCLFMTARSTGRSCSRRTTGDHQTRIVLPIHHPSHSFKRFATVHSHREFGAAPEIDMQQLRPARIVPASSAYFSGIPQYTDDYLALDRMYRKYTYLPTVWGNDVPRRLWIDLETYRSMVGEKVQPSKFARIKALLKRMNRIHPQVMPEEMQEVMKKYLSPAQPSTQKPPPPTIDEEGKAKGVGRRKEASAQVWLVEGEGEVLINGKNIIRVFPRLHDRESALWPLMVSDRVDKYNVWALVSGGGPTGQAEAITLGIARALMVHEPSLKPMLRAAGCVTRDHRRVERKKHGHVKARKMPTWVKR